MQGQGLRDRASDFNLLNVHVLGVSFDPVDKNRAFHDKYGFNFPLLSDVDRSVGMAYGACDTPQASTAARIAYLIGADGSIERSFGKVSAGQFAQLALEACAG